MKKKSVFILLLLFILVWSFFPTGSRNLHANSGPKPSVTLNFAHMPEGEYYVTLLFFNQKEAGPYNSQDPRGGKKYLVWDKFVQYPTPPITYFVGNVQECSQTQQYVWLDYPPERFHVLIYLPKQDRFLITEKPLDRNSFHSAYKVDFQGLDPATAQHFPVTVQEVVSNDAVNRLPGFGLRYLVILLCELGVAWFFHFRSPKQVAVLAGTNLLSFLLLNLAALNGSFYTFLTVHWVLYLLFQALLCAMEAFVYSITLYKFDPQPEVPKKPVVYAFVANLLSAAAVYGVTVFFPRVW